MLDILSVRGRNGHDKYVAFVNESLAIYYSKLKKTNDKNDDALNIIKIIHCVSKKLHPFYFCNNFVDPGPIWIIFGRYVANEFYSGLQGLGITQD